MEVHLEVVCSWSYFSALYGLL